MKAVVFTLGCKVNECESHSLIQGLIRRGYEVSDKLTTADLYIVNTCAVTKEAEKKSRQTVSRIKKLNEKAKIIFTGCATQKSPKAFIDKSDTYLVTGTFNKNKILDLLDSSGMALSEEDKEFEELLPVKSLRTRAFIKVEDGCNNFCSYCIIPYLRGRVRSRNPQRVLEELNNINAKEAVITGINLSAYNYKGINLSGLLKALKTVKIRLRLGSLEVGVITRELLENAKGLYDFAPHFHLSLQSGSDNVLKKMNRHYTTDEFYEKVNLIREYFPNAGITTDVIAGFPTETEQDFIDGLEFIKKVGFTDIHPFTFSPRDGTVASKMQDLSGNVKQRRLERLLEVKTQCHNKFIESQLGKSLVVLLEEKKDEYFTGYTENYLRVYVKGENLGDKLVKVKIEEKFLDGAIALIE